MFNIFKRNKAAKDQAAYVLVMFDAPGPINPEAEMKLLLPMVMQKSGLKVNQALRFGQQFESSTMPQT